MAAGDLAQALGVPHNSFSAHAKTLESAGLVRSERRSRSIIYKLNVDAIDEVGDFLGNIAGHARSTD